MGSFHGRIIGARGRNVGSFNGDIIGGQGPKCGTLSCSIGGRGPKRGILSLGHYWGPGAKMRGPLLQARGLGYPPRFRCELLGRE